MSSFIAIFIPLNFPVSSLLQLPFQYLELRKNCFSKTLKMSHRAVRKAMARFDKLIHKRRRAPACSDENQHQNSADEVTKAPKSDLRHIGTTYIASSESLAATQFSQDNEKFAYSGHETYGCDEIRSPHTNRQQPLYYMQAGELETVHGGEPEDNGQSISPPHDAIYRPDWRQAAAQTGRAGNAYDYARSEPHLADRLFLQQELMPPDLVVHPQRFQGKARHDSCAACAAMVV